MNSALKALVATMLLLCGSVAIAEENAPAADPPPHVVVAGNIVRSQGAIPYKANMTVTSAILASAALRGRCVHWTGRLVFLYCHERP